MQKIWVDNVTYFSAEGNGAGISASSIWNSRDNVLLHRGLKSLASYAALTQILLANSTQRTPSPVFAVAVLTYRRQSGNVKLILRPISLFSLFIDKQALCMICKNTSFKRLTFR